MLALSVMSHHRWLMTGRTSFCLTELRGKGTKLGEGEGNKLVEGKRHQAWLGGKVVSWVSPAQSLG